MACRFLTLRTGRSMWSKAVCWLPRSGSTCSAAEKVELAGQPSDKLVCAVDLGGTNLRAANIDSSGRLHERAKFPTPESDKPEDIVKSIVAAVERCEGEASKRAARIEAVSVAVPGSVHAQTRAIVNAPNIPAIVNFALAEALETKLQRPVLLENDANAAALGEMWQGAAGGSRTIICLTLGTGVGSGIILNGEL